jgi:FtsH-binding integral membrane protein
VLTSARRFVVNCSFLLAVGGAGIFSIYIVYDTNELILRHSVDEYVWASVGLYLDIINLFLKLLQILQYLQVAYAPPSPVQRGAVSTSWRSTL